MLFIWYPKNRTNLNTIHEENDVIGLEELARVNPIHARGSLGTPQRFLSITLRAFEIILSNLVTFPKIYREIR